MKFVIEFSQSNLSKFRQFIKLCNKTFNKTGIIMSIIKDIDIRVCADPFSISDQFLHSEFETKAMEIYKSFTFIEYPLISINTSKKNSTYNTMEVKLTERNNNQNMNQEGDTLKKDGLTFRISREEFNDLNNLLNNSFTSSSELTIKAANKPDFLKKEEAKNYSNGYLSIFDKSKNSIKSGILFKPLKKFIKIYDYEDDFLSYNEQDKDNYNINPNLGNYLYHSPMKSKFLKKFCSMASGNFNKNINIYTFKERVPNEKFDKNHLIISYLNNSFFVGCFIRNNDYVPNANTSIYLEQLKKIYKITLNYEIIIKLLKNFVNDPKNPDYMAVWTKGLVMKTNYAIENDVENFENGNQNNQNAEGDPFEQEEISENENDVTPVIILKSLIYYPNEMEVIEYDEKEEEENKLSKKDYVLNLIENNIDDAHEELNNKSFDCSLDDIGEKDISLDDNIFFNDDDDDENKKENNIQENKENNGDISNDEEKTEENKKKKKKSGQKMKKPKKDKKKNKNENKDE